MDGTRDRAAQGVELANQAGTVILQIREGTSEAVQAVSAFANERKRQASSCGGWRARSIVVACLTPRIRARHDPG